MQARIEIVESEVGKEICITLPNGCTLRCGEGEEYQWGGHVRLCGPDGEELPDANYWDKREWADEPESVMGAIFGAVLMYGQ